MDQNSENTERGSFLEYFTNLDPVEFKTDFSKSLEQFEWISGFISGFTVVSAGGICPFQAEGLIDGLPFYYRERGTITLKVNHKDAENAYGSNVLYFADAEDLDENYQPIHWLNTLFNLVENLRPGPYLYEFPSKFVKFNDPKDPGSVFADSEERIDLVRAWGNSAQEAYENTKRIDPYLLSKGWTEEVQQNYWKIRDISSVPLNEDDRIYPEVAPDFSVKVPDSWRDKNGLINIPEEFLKEKGLL